MQPPYPPFPKKHSKCTVKFLKHKMYILVITITKFLSAGSSGRIRHLRSRNHISPQLPFGKISEALFLLQNKTNTVNFCLKRPDVTSLFREAQELLQPWIFVWRQKLSLLNIRPANSPPQFFHVISNDLYEPVSRKNVSTSPRLLASDPFNFWPISYLRSCSLPESYGLSWNEGEMSQLWS